ncbi:MAG: Uncharacterised protein [Rhodospirillaceae bacterium]|nr:MAG: Uncharacterised protein [Rhodospirillaceae bacterium]
MAQAVVFLGFDHLPVLGGIIAKPARVEGPHLDVGGAVDHPAGQLAGQARPPADADLCPAAAPVVLRARDRADQWVAVRRVRDRAVDFALDPQFGQYRHPLHGVFQPRHDPVIVGLEQLVFSLPRAMVDPDRVRVGLLVNTNQAGFLFHADIARDLGIVAHHRQFGVQIPKRRHSFGDKIVVGHGRHGQGEPRPLPHLPGVGASGVDHMLAGDVALLGEDLPLAAVELLDVRCPAAADDARTQLPRPGRQRLGNAAGVDVAIVRGVQRPDHTFEVVEGVECGDPLRANELDVEAECTPHGQRMAQPVHFVFAVRQPERATAMPRDRLPGLGLQRPGIEPDVVVHALTQRERTGGVGDLPRRVPRRARCQLGLLQ